MYTKLTLKAILLAILLLPATAKAQMIIDTWNMTTGVDTTLWYNIDGVDSVIIASGNIFSACSGVRNIGFDFTLGVSTYSQFSTNINGTVRLGSTPVPSSGGYSNALNQSNGPKIEPFGWRGRFDDNCYTRMALLGTAGNRVRVVETRMKDYTFIGDSLYVSFQVQLFETGGFRVVYGESDSGAVHSASSVRLQNGVSATVNNNNRDIIFFDFATHEAVRLNTTCSLYNTAELWPEKGRWYNLEPDASPCPYPGDITVVSNNPDSTVLSWPAVTGANYHMTIAEVGLNTILTDTFVCITGMLNGAVTYSGTLQTMCADGSESYRTREFSFTTANGPVNSLPWTADFDNATAAANWNITLRADQISNWERRTLSGNGYMYSGAIDNPAYTADAWLISPPISLPAYDDVPLLWDYRSLQSTNRYDTPVIDVMVAVCDTTDAIDTSAAAWTKMMTLEGLVPNYKTYCLNLVGYSGHRVRVAFARHGFCFGTAYIDNVRIGTADTLARIYAPLHPMVGDTTELRALYVGVDTIATPFNWSSVKHNHGEAMMTARPDSRVVDIVYFAAGFDTITLQYGDRADTLVVLVKDCATASTYPWRDDFENGSDCWTLPSNNRWYLHRYQNCAYDGSCYMRSKTNPATSHNRLLSNTFVMPSAADIAYMSLIFQARNTYNNSDAHLSVYFALDSNNAETLLIDTVIGWGTYRQIIVPLSNLAGQTGHFVFEHWTSSTSTNHDIYLDDVEVRYAADPVITHNIPDHIYVGDTNIFTATISEGSTTGLAYNWTLALGHADTIGNGHDGNLHIVYLSGGVDTIIVTATNAYGSTRDTIIITICEPIDQFPWQADFNDRGCWYTADAQDWAIVNNYTVNHNVLSAWGDLSTQGTIAMPTMQLPMDTTLTLDYKTRGNSVYSVLLTTGNYGSYDSVLYNGTVTSGGNFAWQNISLGAYAGQRVRIAFSKPHNYDVIQIDSIIVRSHNYPIIILEAPRLAFTDGAATATVRLTHGDSSTMVYQWHSTLLSTTVTQTSPLINLTYTTTGIDTLSVIGSNNYGSDSAMAVTVVTTWDTLQAPCVVDNFDGGNLNLWYQDANCSWQEYLGTARSYWYNPTVDARMVSRAIMVPSWADDSLVLEWKAAAESYNTVMRYYVLATTGDYTDYSQYDTLFTFDTVLNTAQVAWNIGRVGLGAYAGQTIHVAFVNHPTATFSQYNARALRLDDVQIINLQLPQVRIVKPSVAHSGEPTLVRAELVEGTSTGLSCTWHSTMVTAGLATMTANNDSLHLHYTSAGTDTISVVVTTVYGTDTAITTLTVQSCADVNTLPWSENWFYTSGLGCWRSYNFTPTNNSDWWYSYQSGMHSGQSYSGYDANNWLISPAIQMPDTPDCATLRYRLRAPYTHQDGYLYSAELDVLVSTGDATDTSSFNHVLFSGHLYIGDNINDSRLYEAVLDSFAGQRIHLAFVHRGPHCSIYIDSVSIREGGLPQVILNGPVSAHTNEPYRLVATVTAGGHRNLTYSWHSTLLGTTFFASDTAVLIYPATGTDTVTVTVSNAFGSSSDTVFVNVYDCPTITLPWYENFEDSTSADCWNTFALHWNSASEYEQIAGSWHRTGDSTGYHMQVASAARDFLITPAVALPDTVANDDLILQWSQHSYWMTVLVSPTAQYDNAADFTDTIADTVTNGTFSVSLKRYAGRTVRIAFMANYSYGATMTIDDVSITHFIDTTHVDPPDTVWRTVSVTADAPNVCQTYGSGLYADSSMVEIGYYLTDTIAIGGHWEFLSWSDGPTETPRTILVTSDTAIVAQFQWVADTTQAITQSSIQAISIYPNPSHGDVTITVGEPSTVSIIDIHGRTFFPPTHFTSTHLPFSLPHGTYFVRVATTSNVTVRKLIVE